MFVLKLELAGGFPAESAPMTGDELVALFNEGMVGQRPTAVVVDGTEVSWVAFRTIFNLDRGE